MRADVGRYGEMWADVGRYGEMRADVGRFAEVWAGVGRCGEIAHLYILEKVEDFGDRESRRQARVDLVLPPGRSRHIPGAAPARALPAVGESMAEALAAYAWAPPARDALAGARLGCVDGVGRVAQFHHGVGLAGGCALERLRRDNQGGG